MAQTMEKIRSAIQLLSLQEKEALLRDLVTELDTTPDPATDAAWLATAQNRVLEIDEGRVQCVPASEVFDRLDASLRKK